MRARQASSTCVRSNLQALGWGLGTQKMDELSSLVLQDGPIGRISGVPLGTGISSPSLRALRPTPPSWRLNPRKSFTWPPYTHTHTHTHTAPPRNTPTRGTWKVSNFSESAGERRASRGGSPYSGPTERAGRAETKRRPPAKIRSGPAVEGSKRARAPGLPPHWSQGKRQVRRGVQCLGAPRTPWDGGCVTWPGAKASRAKACAGSSGTRSAPGTRRLPRPPRLR